MNDKKMPTLAFLIFTLLAISTIVTIIFWGRNQDKRFSEDEREFVRAEQILVSEEERNNFNLDIAIRTLEDLENKQPNSIIIKRDLGLAYAVKRDFETAAKEYRKAVELKPFLIQDPSFMLEYGTILFNIGSNDEAYIILERARTLKGPGVDKIYLGKVDELVKNIGETRGGGQ